jgi:hypothetical protein
MRALFASLLVCFAFCHGWAQSAADVLAGESRFKGGVVALYNPKEMDAAAVVRFTQAYTDYESKGFFRIGILPIGVVEGVVFELPHPESVTNSLARVHQWLGPRTPKRLELRHVSFVVSAPTTNRLETGRARLAAEGKLALLDGVTFTSGTNQIQAARGALQITGTQAGQLVMETVPPCTYNLFGRIDTPQSSNKATEP